MPVSVVHVLVFLCWSVVLLCATFCAIAIARQLNHEAASPTTQGVCDSIHGLQCWGDDLKNIGPVSSHGECCQACQALPGCNAWTWNWQYGHECYLKSVCSDRRNSSSHHSGIAVPGPKPAPTTPSPPPPPSPPPGPSAQGVCDSIHGLQCWGDDLKNIGAVSTHEECCQACLAFPGCNAWTWNWQYGRECYLKSACSDKRNGSSYHSGIAVPAPGPPPVPSPIPPTPSPGNTPFAALGCHSASPLDDSSIWQGSSGRWHSCDQDVRSDGVKKCIRANGQVDETSLFLDLSTVESRGGCFVWESTGCGTDMTRVSKIEFDFDFSQCHDVWAAPLWITPEHWISPAATSGEIDFIEMCPVGSVATNFGAAGQQGESQQMWGTGSSAKGPKHFTLLLDASGNLKTRICNLDGKKCFDGAHYDGFINSITSKHKHHFVSDVWNGHGGDSGWGGCGAKHNAGTQCRYAIMNLRVHSNDGQPLYEGRCAALNGESKSSVSGAFLANSTVIV